MTTEQERAESRGCLLLMGIISVSVGVGCAFGAPFGWIAFGVICLFGVCVIPA